MAWAIYLLPIVLTAHIQYLPEIRLLYILIIKLTIALHYTSIYRGEFELEARTD